MIGEPGSSVVRIEWVTNPFRADRFEEVWRPAAEAALDYGASAYAFLRSKDDPIRFTQYAAFADKLEFERYWLSEEIAEVRALASGLFNLPILPVWLQIVGAGAPAAARS
jgi:hypothetical protein